MRVSFAGGLMAVGLIVNAAAAGWLAFERANLHEQLIIQRAEHDAVRQKLTRTELALQESEAALARREAQLAEATKPEVPVRVAFRPAWMGQGMVATLHNVSGRPISVLAEVRDPAHETFRNFTLAIDSGATAQIGPAEGWRITSGQSVTVAALGYKSVSAFAP